jgi:hypothetical protein
LNTITKAVVVIGAFAAPVAPVVSFAQSTEPVTRAQVRAELVALEQTGWHPGDGRTTYPADIQAAEAKLAEKNRAMGVGGDVSGSSEAGHSAASQGK